MTQPAIAYLTSQYPKISESFVIREIMGLKQRGFRVGVASMNRPDRQGAQMTVDERSESEATWYVKSAAKSRLFPALFRTLARRPGGFFNALAMALRLGRWEPKRVFKNLMYLAEGVLIADWMAEEGFDHAHGQLGSAAVTVGLYVKQISNCYFSFTVHGPFEFYDAYGEYLPEKMALADRVVCISHFARSQMMKLSPYDHWHKLEVVRLGVDPEVFRPLQRPERDDVFEVICVGRLAPAKGQHILVDAVRQLVNSGESVRLRLVGDGEDRQALESHVAAAGLQQRVIFEGAVNQDRIRELYAAADVFSIPSFAEGIPVVLMEAMAMGIPCVTTRITGIPELIEDGVSGMLVPPSDVNALAAALLRLKQHPELAGQIRSHARDVILQRYNLPLNIDQLAALLPLRS